MISQALYCLQARCFPPKMDMRGRMCKIKKKKNFAIITSIIGESGIIFKKLWEKLLKCREYVSCRDTAETLRKNILWL